MAPKRKSTVKNKIIKKKAKLSPKKQIEYRIDTSSSSCSVISDAIKTENSDKTTTVVTSIKELNLKMKNWKVEGRVIGKFPIKHWKKNEREGKLFNLIICDESGEIRITGYDESVDRIYNEVIEDEIYTIENGRIQLTDKNYNKTGHDYEIVIDDTTHFEICNFPTKNVPGIKMKLKTIEQIYESENNTTIDVIGICSEITDIEEFTAKTTGRHLKKKEITLKDQTGRIQLILWNEFAEDDFEEQTILLVTKAKLNEFRSVKNISSTMNTIIKKNPEIKQTHLLKKMIN